MVKEYTPGTVIISTPLGNTLLPENSPVLVQVSENNYQRKFAKDVNLGDLILYDRDHVTKDFSMDMLRDSSRYVEAENQVYNTVNGVKMPLLRTLLAKGMQEELELSDEDLEAKLSQGMLHESKDFTPTEYKIMTDIVFENLQTYGDDSETRAKSSIQSWLKGKYLAPSNWDIFYLLTEINPDFEDIFESKEMDEDFYKSYELYTTLRRNVAGYFAKPGAGGSGATSKLATNKNTILPEVKLILNTHFGDIVNNMFVPVKVDKVKHNSPKRGKSKPRHLESVLSKGVYVDDGSKTQGLKVKGTLDILGDFSTLEEIYTTVIFDRFIKRDLKQSPYLKYIDLILKSHYSTLNYPISKYEASLIYIPSNIEEDVIEQTNRLINTIDSGELDNYLGLSKSFQIKKLLKTMDQLAQRIPHGLQEWLINRFKMASKKENNLPINKRLKEENRSLYLKHVKPLGVTSKYCGSISPRDRIEIKEGESLEDAVLRIEKSIDGHFRRSKELYQVLLDYDLSDFSVFDEFFESNGMIVNIK